LLKLGEDEKRRTYKLFGDNSNMNEKEKEACVATYQKELADEVYPNGGQLRDYQAEGVSWMMANLINQRSSILADEMVRKCS
jgi:SNF2 family DNA or RNA helicase